MKYFILLITYLLPKLILANTEVNFPSDIQRCKHEDSNCLINTINYILANKFQGERGINLASISPLHVNELTIKQGKESPVNINLQFKNNDIYGFKEASAIKIKGFTKNLNETHEVIMKTNVMSLIGNYKINGKVLILPIQGEGTSNITLVRPSMKMTFHGEPFEKNGKTYMNVKNYKIELKTKRLVMHLSNLFNGDKALGDNMNEFINENWSDIFGELKGSIETSFGKILKEVIENVFKSHPYNELFL